MIKKNRSEFGQVIYLLAVGIITLLGFTALAIDGARMFSERRTIQGVADTAAFTAAAYIGQYKYSYVQANFHQVDDHAEQAALERVNSNGYIGPLYDPINGSNDFLRIVVTPYTEGMADGYLVDVKMISEIDPIFAQVIYHGPMRVDVQSQAVVFPQHNVAFGQAMYSTSEDACNAISFSGNADTYIIGSGIYANSTCTPNAINFAGTSDMSVSGEITTPGGIDTDGGAIYTSGGDVEGAPAQTLPDIPLPDCSGLPAGYYVNDMHGTITFFPGVWHAKITINSAANHQIFVPGLYCLEGGLTINNGNVTAHDVTFFVPNSKDVAINGGLLDLIAPRHGEADDGTNSWNGMLFYMQAGSWSVQGSAGTYLEGTVYAPGPPDPTCKLTGSGLTDGYNLQLVCNTIALIGGAGLNIDYQGNNQYEPPVSIDLLH